MRRALVTGITGFVGSHLAARLLADGFDVHGIARDVTTRAAPPDASRVRLHRADLLDAAAVERALREARPDVVVHLAAQAIPARSWQDPRGTVETNVVGTVVLLEALRALGTSPLLLLASTGEVYADAREDELPLTEDHPVRPASPYAASKVAQEVLVRQYGTAGHVRPIILRTGNQVGPRMSPELAPAAFARQIAEAERAGGGVVRFGNLEARRDFVDVRDVARAYSLAIERGESGRTYNVATGNAVPVRDVLDHLVAESTVRLRLVEDPARRRRDDRDALALDASAFRARTGWRPEIPLRRSLADLLEQWRAAVASTAEVAR